jgi:hypothetical protein
MGANFDYRIYRTADRAEAARQWDEAVRESEVEDGMSYSGCIGMLRGKATWKDLKLADEDAAWEYLEEHHQKWSPALAVSFRASDPEAIRAREERARDLHMRANELAREYFRSDLAAAGDFPECRACGSKLSRKHLRSIGGHCPVCCDPRGLMSAEHAEEVARLISQAQEATQAPIAAEGAGIWWMVGGQCAS